MMAPVLYYVLITTEVAPPPPEAERKRDRGREREGERGREREIEGHREVRFCPSISSICFCTRTSQSEHSWSELVDRFSGNTPKVSNSARPLPGSVPRRLLSAYLFVPESDITPFTTEGRPKPLVAHNLCGTGPRNPGVHLSHNVRFARSAGGSGDQRLHANRPPLLLDISYINLRVGGQPACGLVACGLATQPHGGLRGLRHCNPCAVGAISSLETTLKLIAWRKLT